MTAQNDTHDDGSDVSVSNYTDGGDDLELPAVFAQHKTGRFEQTTVFGEGAEAEVVVDDGELSLTLTVDGFENPAELLDHDILSVELNTKDLPTDGEQ